jgi:DNA-directed RNA polymerase specialized sigma24 family protein
MQTSLPTTSPAPAASRDDWLATLAHDSLGDFELTPEIDRDLTQRALAARHARDDRDQLFTLLAYKTLRFCARFQRWNLDPWEPDDVVQEGWLAFHDVLQTWRPLTGSHGPAGFGYYYLRVFPLRLHDRVLALTGTRRDRPTPLPWLPDNDARCDPDDYEGEALTRLILAEICGQLNAVETTILRGRLTDDTPSATLVSATGLSRSTFYRRWARITAVAADVLGVG